MKLRTNIILCLCVCAISFVVVRKTDAYNYSALYRQITDLDPKPDSLWFDIENHDFNLWINGIGSGSIVTLGEGEGRHKTTISQIAAYGFNSKEVILYVRDIYGNYFYMGERRFGKMRYICGIGDTVNEKIYISQYKWIKPSDTKNLYSEINARQGIAGNFTKLCILLSLFLYFFLNIAIFRKLKVKKKTITLLLSRIPILTLLFYVVLFFADLPNASSVPIYTGIKVDGMSVEVDDKRLLIFSGDTLFLSSEKEYPDCQFYLKNITVYDSKDRTESIQGMRSEIWAYNGQNIVFRSEDIWYKIKRMHNKDNNSYIVAQKCEDEIEGDSDYTIIEQPKHKIFQAFIFSIAFGILILWGLFEILFVVTVLIAFIVKLIKYYITTKKPNKSIPL